VTAFFFLLWVANCLIAAVALYRVRPCTFIFATNQVIGLRALQRIAEGGQPQSAEYLPPYVFADANISIASKIFLISTIGLLVAALLPSPRKKSDPPAREMMAVPKPVLLVVGVYFILLILSRKTMFQVGYSEDERFVFGLNISGAHVLAVGVLLYELCRRTITGRLHPRAAFASILLLFFLTDFLKGSTGIATGTVLTAAVLFFGMEKSKRLGLLFSASSLAVLLGIAVFARGVRQDLASEGMVAVDRFVGTLAQPAGDESGLEHTTNGEQTATHVLECITLYEAGISREWRSIYNPVIYTFEPSFLLEPLGVTRPKEAAWELADYFIHGGGINTLGEFYWNGGYFCVLIMVLVLVGWVYLLDSRWRRGGPWLLMACCFAPGFLQGFGYGFAQVSRGAFNGLLGLACGGAFAFLRRRGAQVMPRTAGPSGAGPLAPIRNGS
jgi:hypothetical protein